MRRKHRLLACACALAALSTACSGGNEPPRTGARRPAKPQAAVDPASVHANELGVVPVLMYHQLRPVPKGEFDQTPAQFRAEIERLATEGYWPVTAADFSAGRLDIPAGRSPVVLTFDDAVTNQFALRADRSIDPDTAVGILLDVGRHHPDFHPVATMYVNRDPFGTSRYQPLLAELTRLGFEIGDHTFDHIVLRNLDGESVEREIALGEKVITDALPGAAVTTLALPLGVRPADHALAVRGSYQDISYAMTGVFLVGANPAPSPYSGAFDPSAIPRIRSGQRMTSQEILDSTHWLDILSRNPASRYVSDGNPATVSFPRAMAGRLAPAFAAAARPY